MEQSKLLVILGQRGKGKSFLAKRLISQITNKVFIYDPLNEYDAGDYCGDNFETLFNFVECQSSVIRFSSDNDNDFDRFCRVFYETQSDAYLICDEVDKFAHAKFCPPYFKKIIRYGRHKNQGIIGIARRPANVSRDLTSQASLIVSFKQHEPRDVSYLAEFMPDAEQVLTLPDYHFVCYDSDAGVTTRDTINFP